MAGQTSRAGTSLQGMDQSCYPERSEGPRLVGVGMLRCAQHDNGARYDKVPEHDNGAQYGRILLALLDQALRVCYSCGEESERFDNGRGERMGADLSEIIINGILRGRVDHTGTGDDHGQEAV